MAGITASSMATFMAGCNVDKAEGWQPVFLTPEESDMLAEITEQIIPRTDTPGAKDALVHRFLDSYFKDNLTEEYQTLLRDGLKSIDDRTEQKFSESFVKASSEQRDEVLIEIEDELGDLNIVSALKSLTIMTFFTSEIGAKEVLNFDPIPGEYKGCIPLSEVGSCWAL